MPSLGSFLTLNKSQPISPQQCRALSVQGWAARRGGPACSLCCFATIASRDLGRMPCSCSIPSCEKGEFKLSLENASAETLCGTLLGFHISCFLSRSDPGDGGRVRAESKVLQSSSAGWVWEGLRWNFCALLEALWVSRAP